MKHPLLMSFGSAIVDPAGGLFTPTGGTSVLQVDATMLRNGGSSYHPELQYLGLLQELVDKADGDVRPDRTGTGTYSVFGRQIRFELSEGFPLLTTKKLDIKSIVGELLWMLSGSTSVVPLQEQGIRIWNEWADESGDLGPVYGRQWRSWATQKTRVEEGVTEFMGMDYTIRHPVYVDQIDRLLTNLREKPHDRGHVVSAWNVAQLDEMALRPCHCLFQFYVDDGKLSCQLYQRSADIFLGVPFNIASYALLTHLIAREVRLEVGEFVHTFGDLHLYANHVEQAKEQLQRTPTPLPTVEITSGPGLFEITPKDIEFLGYNPHPTIKAKVSV